MLSSFLGTGHTFGTYSYMLASTHSYTFFVILRKKLCFFAFQPETMSLPASRLMGAPRADDNADTAEMGLQA